MTKTSYKGIERAAKVAIANIELLNKSIQNKGTNKMNKVVTKTNFLSDLEKDALTEGKCSCPQALWYLDILKRLLTTTRHDTNLKEEIERAIKYGDFNV